MKRPSSIACTAYDALTLSILHYIKLYVTRVTGVGVFQCSATDDGDWSARSAEFENRDYAHGFVLIISMHAAKSTCHRTMHRDFARAFLQQRRNGVANHRLLSAFVRAGDEWRSSSSERGKQHQFGAGMHAKTAGRPTCSSIVPGNYPPLREPSPRG